MKKKEEAAKGYCVRCKKKQTMKNTEPQKLKNGMNGIAGQCIKCDCKMFLITGKA